MVIVVMNCLVVLVIMICIVVLFFMNRCVSLVIL